MKDQPSSPDAGIGFPRPRKDWDPQFTEQIIAGERLLRSGRAEDVIAVWRDEHGVDIDGFVRRHCEGRVNWRYCCEPERGMGGAVSYVGSGLSFMDRERFPPSTDDDCYGPPRDSMRLVLIDTSERTLLLESYDLRCLLEKQRLPPETHRLWREAVRASRETGIVIDGACEAMGVLLDELERSSILERFVENDVDLGRFF